MRNRAFFCLLLAAAVGRAQTGLSTIRGTVSMLPARSLLNALWKPWTCLPTSVALPYPTRPAIMNFPN